MKRFLLKIGAIILLSVSIVFGSSILPSNLSTPFTDSAYAETTNDDGAGEQQLSPTGNQTTPTSQTTPFGPTQLTTPSDHDLNSNSDNQPSEDSESKNQNDQENKEGEDDKNSDDEKETPNICSGQAGSVSWILCPLLNTTSSIVDSIYGLINNLLVIRPISTDHNSGIYKVWQKVCEITNVIFVIFVLVVLYSQITGFGVNNYGIKRILPRLIVAIILVNLSFFISSLLIDLSNIVGSGLIDFFTNIQEEIQVTMDDPFTNITWGELSGAFLGGASVGFIAVTAMGGIGAAFWMLVVVLIGALISVFIGLLTIGLRQGVVLVLIMASPLAFVAYLLPNTEKWFKQWKTILAQMLFFYPMFSFLYGASKLAGWAIISAADKNPIFVLLGFAVQVMPLVLSISLLKMSNTVLGGINNTLNRLTNPLRHTAGQWGISHAERSRQGHLDRNRVVSGARLQNFLAQRRMNRELDTADLKDTVTNRNLTRVLGHRSSYRGSTANGQDTWKKKPNRSTQIAKKASYYRTVSGAAQQNFANTLGEYGDIFSGESTKALADAHGESYLDIMRQQFRAENIAQGDQNFLLGRYLGAAKKQKEDPYEFNRLIGGATGKLGHAGETTIMGQVIKRSAEIEERRRAESRIVTTKFGVNKSAYRGMLLDKARINDNGFEEDENGNVIENSQYRYLDKDGNDTSHLHRGWGQYIAVHKETNEEITKAEYDTLSPTSRSKYKKIKYMEIKDDDGDVVQRVYDDDAGYMKEMLRQDIAIGDPINRRYATEIGLQIPKSELERLQHQFPDLDWETFNAEIKKKDRGGILRRYHSTIAGALLDSRYSEHAAEYSAMLTAQLDRGFVTTVGQRNIAGLDSLLKASKTGKLVLNDAFVIQDWIKIIKSAYTNNAEIGERFEDYFPDIDIALARNVNGEYLNGLRRTIDDKGNLVWKKISRNDPSISVEDKKNWIKHQLIPEVAKKLYGALNRNPSQELLNGAKPDGIDTFKDMLDTIAEINLKNINPDTPFDQRLNPSVDMFASTNPSELPRKAESWIDKARNEIPGYAEINPKSSKNNKRNGNNFTQAADPGSNPTQDGPSGSSSSTGQGSENNNQNSNSGARGFDPDLLDDLDEDYSNNIYGNTPYNDVVYDIQNIFIDTSTDFHAACNAIRSYFNNHRPLSDPDTCRALEYEINDIQDDHYQNTSAAINGVTDYDKDRKRVNELYHRVINIVNHAYSF